MLVKKFEAPSLEQALAQVKKEMGPNALILSTEQKRGTWFQKSLVQVTAAFEKRAREEMKEHFDEDELQQVFPHRRRAENVEQKASRSLRQLEESATKPVPRSKPLSAASPATNQVAIDPQYYEKDFLRVGFSPESSRELSRRLVFDYSKKDLLNATYLDRTKSKLVAGHLHTISPDIFKAKSCWSIVGGPGVGKTSFLVKLALVLRQQTRNVMLVSLDGKKVVGRSELAAYAKLLDLPFSHESTPVWTEAQGVQLFDTPSLAFQSDLDNQEIEKMCRNRNTILVLDAAARLSELQRTIEMAKRFAPTAIAFTRLDVVAEPGVVYDVLKSSRIPLLALSLSGAMKGSLRFFEPIELAGFLLNPSAESRPEPISN